METYGIIFKNEEIVCPLEKVRVDAHLDAEKAYVNITQEYYYNGEGGIEAIYKFPLSYSGQVTGFKVKIGNREIKSELQEKDKAFKAYENAIRKGDSAFLLESHRPDIFQISLGNIMSKDRISITISYNEDLTYVDDELRWILPTVIAPRYSPVDEAPELTINIDETKYTLEVNIRLLASDRIKKVSSPSHALEFSNDKNDIIIRLAKEIEYLDRDLVLNLVLNNVLKNSFSSGIYKKGEGFGAIRFIPELEEYQTKRENKEYIFILDTSGSMDGEKLQQGKRALKICLRNLLEGDTYNIISFSNNFSRFEKELVNYSQVYLDKATKWIDSLTAYGGTEILEPIKYALELPKKKDVERVIFLFTDGQVYNDQHIFQTVRDKNNGVRLYPFGIDTAVNKYFIDELAVSGNGLPEFVYPGERIEDKVINQLSRINQPYLSNIKVKGANGEELEVFPIIPKRFFNNEEYNLVFKLIDEKNSDFIIIEGKINEEDINIKLLKTSEVDGELLGIKWAKENIKYLESLLITDNKRRVHLIKEDIVRLSVEYGVLSTQTALVGVYEREDKNRGHIKTITIPVNAPSGWNMASNGISYQLKESVSNILMDIDSNLQANEFEIPVFLRRQKVTRGIDSRKRDRLKESMLEVVANQNADGSLGKDKKGIKTAYFIIAMLLYTKEFKPYYTQIKKAVFYLLDQHDKSLEAYLAMKFAYENSIYTEMDIEDRIDNFEKDDISGNAKYLYKSLISSPEDFSSILLNKNMNNSALIEYLFKII